ncbi:hypothetical protein [Xenorhabdus taiwanensis]
MLSVFQPIVCLPLIERSRRQGQDTVGIYFAELFRKGKGKMQRRRTG